MNTPMNDYRDAMKENPTHAGTAGTTRAGRCAGTPRARDNQRFQACAAHRQPTHLRDRSRHGIHRPCRVRSHQCNRRYSEQPRPQRLRPQGLRSRRPGPPERIHWSPDEKCAHTHVGGYFGAWEDEDGNVVEGTLGYAFRFDLECIGENVASYSYHIEGDQAYFGLTGKRALSLRNSSPTGLST